MKGYIPRMTASRHLIGKDSLVISFAVSINLGQGQKAFSPYGGNKVLSYSGNHTSPFLIPAGATCGLRLPGSSVRVTAQVHGAGGASGDAEDTAPCQVGATTTAAPRERVTTVVASAGRTAASCTTPRQPTPRAAHQELPVHHNPFCTAEHSCTELIPPVIMPLFKLIATDAGWNFRHFIKVCSAASSASTDISHHCKLSYLPAAPHLLWAAPNAGFSTGMQEATHPWDHSKPMKFSDNLDSLKKLPGGRKAILNGSKTMLKAKTKADFYFEVSSNPP